MKHPLKGFTLVELMVAIVLVITLSSLGFAGYTKVMDKARMTTELNAARNLTIAYLTHASDHSGRLMPGYRSDPEATNLDGEILHHPINARYPWRLTPYMPQPEGILLCNGHERFLEADNSDYLVSVRPNLGINAVYVGGHYGSGSPLRPSPRLEAALGKYYVSRISQAVEPAKLVVFASARHGGGDEGVGNFEVRAPNTLAPDWSSAGFDPKLAASDHGFVDFRWDGKAVVAMLGGNVELLNEEELRDMRRWSNQAARANDPDFVVSVDR